MIFLCIYTLHFIIHSWITWIAFTFLFIVNNATVDWVYKHVWYFAFNPFMYIIRSGIAGSYMVILCLVFEEPPYSFPQWLHHLTFPPVVHKSFCFSVSFQHLLLSSSPLLPSVPFLFLFSLFPLSLPHPSLLLSHSNRCEVVTHCGSLWSTFMFFFLFFWPSFDLIRYGAFSLLCELVILFLL